MKGEKKKEAECSDITELAVSDCLLQPLHFHYLSHSNPDSDICDAAVIF